MLSKDDLQLLQRYRSRQEHAWPKRDPELNALVRGQKKGWLRIELKSKDWVRVQCSDTGLALLKQALGETE